MKTKTQNLTNCQACGAAQRRGAAKFCAVCGHNLLEEYAPLDALRASYNLRRKEQKTNSPAPKPKNQKIEQPKELFAENRNGASATAMAFVVYSLVPYLGILFCPGALVLGGIGLAVSFQKPHIGGRQTATYSILLGSIILAIQVLLWYLLYIIPELNR